MNRRAAFSFLTRCLTPDRPESPRRAKLARELASGRVDWPRVVEVASHCWTTLALFHELREKGLLDPLPADLIEYFEYLHVQNRSRNLALLDHAGHVAGLLNAIGVEPLLLKGICHLASGLYPDPAVRFLYDLDIVVPDDRALECWQHLTSSGYRTLASPHLPADLHQEDMPDIEWPALICEGRTGELELHRSVEWHHMLASPSLYRDSEPVDLRGAKARMLTPTGRMIFTIAHAYVHHRIDLQPGAHLRDLYDARLLSARYGAAIQWSWVRDAFASADEMRALRHACSMWSRWFQEPPPCSIKPSWGTSFYRPLSLVEIEKRRLTLIWSELIRNRDLLRLSFSRTAEGRRLRRSLRPSVFFRKVRVAARICVGLPVRKP